MHASRFEKGCLPESAQMSLHYHSLYAGLLLIPLLLAWRVPYAVGGLIIIPICLLIESGRFTFRLKYKREAWIYAFQSLVQSIALFGLFAGLRFLIFGGGWCVAAER